MDKTDVANGAAHQEPVPRKGGLADRVNRNTPSAAHDDFDRCYPQLC